MFDITKGCTIYQYQKKRLFLFCKNEENSEIAKKWDKSILFISSRPDLCINYAVIEIEETFKIRTDWLVVHEKHMTVRFANNIICF